MVVLSVPLLLYFCFNIGDGYVEVKKDFDYCYLGWRDEVMRDLNERDPRVIGAFSINYRNKYYDMMVSMGDTVSQRILHLLESSLQAEGEGRIDLLLVNAELEIVKMDRSDLFDGESDIHTDEEVAKALLERYYYSK